MLKIVLSFFLFFSVPSAPRWLNLNKNMQRPVIYANWQIYKWILGNVEILLYF